MEIKSLGLMAVIIIVIMGNNNYNSISGALCRPFSLFMLQHLLTQIFLDGERSPTEPQDSFEISVFVRRVNGVCNRSR